jgi:ATP-dependent helicase/DNAse subunit B
VQRVRRLLGERPFAQAWVLLPDRLQTAYFRRRLAEAGGAIGAQVGTFGDLYAELLGRAGCPAPLASSPIVHRLVQTTLEQVYAAGDLVYYAGLKDTPGFALALREAFAELKRALVYPERFIEVAASGSLAQQELARLYQAYQEQLRALGWADPDGLSWLALEALQERPELAEDIELLVMDGFDSFSGAQRLALRLLGRAVRDMLVTLPGAHPFPRPVQRRFERAYRELAASLPSLQRTAAQVSSLPPGLQHLEAHLFEPGSPAMLPDGALVLLEARSPAEESREALRWLKARIVRDHLPQQACAIITPDPDSYHPHLRQAAAEFGMPLHFTQGQRLAHAPAIAALLQLLALAVQNFPRRPLLDAIRSPYFDLAYLGLERRDADVLDLVSRAGQVIEGQAQWAEVFEGLAQSASPERSEPEDGPGSPALPRGGSAIALWQTLQRLLARLAPPDVPQALSDWICWLEDLLDELRFYQSGAGRRDQAAFQELRETLRALALSQVLTGETPLDYARFVVELQGTLNGAGYQEGLPSRQPAIQVLRMIEGRGVRFEAVAILGLAEGIYPQVERADPFLDEPLRQALGLEARLQREQAGLFYQAVTRSDRFLLLTRPYLAKDGEAWEASPYWKSIQALLPENSAVQVRPDDPRPLADTASPAEALFWAIRRRSLPPALADLRSHWESLRHAGQVLRARQASAPQGPFEGQAEAIADEMAAHYGPLHSWSASQLEAYGACPQQFYVSAVLKLQVKVAPEVGLGAAPLGSVLHAILERCYAAAEHPADPQSVLAGLPEIARQVFDNAPREYGFRPSPLWEREQTQLLLALENTILGLANQDARAGWRPYLFERSFGRQNAPALQLQAGGETIHLRGVIDRIDQDAAGRLRIIDYKTGSSHLGKADLLEGRRLQLPIYALAASQALGLGQPVEGLYWSLLKGEPGSLRLSSFQNGDESGPPAAIATALAHISRIVRGVRQADFRPQPPKGGCPAYCPAQTWCWRYEPGWRSA